VEWLQAFGTIAAACGLGLTAWQMWRTRRVADLQALQKFFSDVVERETALATAEGDPARRRAFNEYLNLLELYACAYNARLFIGKKICRLVRLSLIDSYIELDHHTAWHPLIVAALDRSTTLIEFRLFVERHRHEVDDRKAERAKRAQDETR
jgi:hypothetical protein